MAKEFNFSLFRKKVQVNMSNKLFYSFIVVGVFILMSIGVYALTPWNSGSHSVWHSADAIKVNIDGTDTDLQSAVNDGSFKGPKGDAGAIGATGSAGSGGYCYTYYSNSMSSCICPSGETNEKNLGSWGYCYYQRYDGYSNQLYEITYIFRPHGISCDDMYNTPKLYDGSDSFISENRGLACVCCED